MHIGAARLTFHLPQNGSLKGKRQVTRSLIERVRRRFNVAMAEVDANERWQTLVLGVTCVSNQAQHANQMLDTVLEYVQSTRLDLDLVEVEREIIGGV